MANLSGASQELVGAKNIKIKKLLKILSDGNSHSGAHLGESLGITRSAVWKLVKQIKQEMGLCIEAKTNQGYRLQESFELLDLRKIKAHLSLQYHEYIKKSIIFDEITSTNNFLLEQLQNKNDAISVCLAEMQTAGRGKFNRRWLSPFGNNIYLSLLWHFFNDLPQLSGLSLVISVVIIRALKRCGISHGILVKWPNDIMWCGRKLGGVLIDLHGEFNFNCDAVIGIGLNLYLPGSLKKTLDFPATDLTEITQSFPERNKLIAYLLEELLIALAVFQKQGFQPFMEEFAVVNCLLNKPARMILGDEVYSGIGRGVDEEGFFLLETAGGVVKRFSCGEASLRMQK
ncbi:MAG TPA: biotin--[acetyl-CoA-carboxylase] ligase [Gammaproteobacteria bacterium]|nr:biotin--[acetyl-CoA-carboxylase] ligase [Gammaproteobacteria bacterium]